MPTHRRIQRIDRPDRYFLTAQDQFAAALEQTLACHAAGQPVLAVTATIQDSEIFSKMLVDHHVPHSVLNADNAFWEAEIIAAAGQRGAVTVSTGMAGRGTDIKLGEGVAELGGLAVIGIGRMENTRLERQARGRAGRQGDPGSSQFFVSAEDEIVTEMYPEKAEALIDAQHPVSVRRIEHLALRAQRTLEEQSVSTREQAIHYDEIQRRQREILYAARNRLLDGEAVPEDEIRRIVHGNLRRFVEGRQKVLAPDLRRYVLDNLSYELDDEIFRLLDEMPSGPVLSRRLLEYADRLFARKKASFDAPDEFGEYVRACMLHALDEGWIEEVDYLQQLQYASMARGMAQRNPIFEYSREAYRSFQEMEQAMQDSIARSFFLAEPLGHENGILQILFP